MHFTSPSGNLHKMLQKAAIGPLAAFLKTKENSQPNLIANKMNQSQKKKSLVNY